MPNLWQAVTAYLARPSKHDANLFADHRAGQSGPLTMQALADMISAGRMTDAGVYVSETTALNLSAVWCAVQNIAGTIGSLPLILYKRTGSDGADRDEYTDHPLYRILHDEPNREMSAMLFRETVTAHILLWGNGYAEIQRDASRRVVALWPITPDRVAIRREQSNGGSLYYDVSGTNGATRKLTPDQMLHIPGLSYDGVCGYSVIAKARQGLGLSFGTEKFGASLFGYGPRWSGILTHQKNTKPETKAALRADLKSIAPNDFIILEDGLTWTQTGMPADDAQFLETRQFQVIEIARWFNMPPHMLKDLERATFSNIEHQGIDYLTHTLRPWLRRWEEEINRKLISPLERNIQYAEHLVNAILRGDALTRAQTHEVEFRNGALTLDAWNRHENRNSLPGGFGKKHYIMANMIPIEKAGEDVTASSNVEPTNNDGNVPAGGRDLIHAVVTEIKDAIQRALPPPHVAPEPTEIIAVLDEDRTRQLIDEVIGPTVTSMREIAAEITTEVRAMVPPPAPEPEPTPEPEPPPERIEDPVLVEPPPSAADIAAEKERHAQIVLAQRELVAGVVRRMHAREKDKARSAAKTPERLRAWIGDFYPKHADLFRSELLPSMKMHLARTSSEADPECATRALVEDYVEGSRRQLHALLDAQPAELASAVEALLARWDIDRVNLIPDAVMREEMIGHG